MAVARLRAPGPSPCPSGIGGGLSVRYVVWARRRVEILLHFLAFSYTRKTHAWIDDAASVDQTLIERGHGCPWVGGPQVEISPTLSPHRQASESGLLRALTGCHRGVASVRGGPLHRRLGSCGLVIGENIGCGGRRSQPLPVWEKERRRKRRKKRERVVCVFPKHARLAVVFRSARYVPADRFFERRISYGSTSSARFVSIHCAALCPTRMRLRLSIRRVLPGVCVCIVRSHCFVCVFCCRVRPGV